MAFGDKSEFNSSLESLSRINELLKSANSFKTANQIYNWFLVLLSLYAELIDYCDDKDLIKQINKSIEDRIKRFNEILNNIDDEHPAITTLQDFKDLLNLELSLRGIAKKNGFLIKFKELDDIEYF